jgi:hypothetical protein
MVVCQLAKVDDLMTTPPPDQREKMRSALPSRRNRARSVFYLSYRAPSEEAGPEKPFDLSRRTLASRWRSGELDMEAALVRFSEQPHSPLSIIRRQEEAAAWRGVWQKRSPSSRHCSAVMPRSSYFSPAHSQTSRAACSTLDPHTARGRRAARIIGPTKSAADSGHDPAKYVHPGTSLRRVRYFGVHP